MKKVDFVHDDTAAATRQQTLKRKFASLEGETTETRIVRPKRGHTTLLDLHEEDGVLHSGQRVPERKSGSSRLTSVKNRIFSLSAKAVASIKEFKDDISVLFAPRPLQQAPDLKKLEGVPFEKKGTATAEAPDSLPKPLMLRPAATCLRLDINGSLHHEFWDPSENDVCELTGYVYFNSKDAAGDRKPLPRLTNLLLEVYVKSPQSKFGPKDVRIARATVPSAKRSQKPSAKHIPKDERATYLGRGGKVHPLPADSPALHLSLASIKVNGMERNNAEQRVKFTLTIPVGGIIFHSYTTSSVTRTFSIKAKGAAKSVVGGSTCIYICEAVNFKFCITALKKEELMYGRKGSVKLPSDEESRRTLIRDYVASYDH